MRRLLIAAALCLCLASVVHAQAVWKARDVAAKGAFATTHPTLKLESATRDGRDVCTVIDTTGGERSVTLAWCLPLDAVGGTWCDDPQTSRTITTASTKPFANYSERAGGLTDEASTYPLAVVIPRGSEKAIVVACPPDVPRLVKFHYDAKAKELRAEFDFGLSPIPEKFKSRADAAVVTYEVPATWAFRRALQRYYELFPQAFERRVKKAGIWMPFGEIGPIKNCEDFGFAFHEMGEVNARILGDDAKLGVASFVYIEPQTYWQWFKGKGKGTYEERYAQLEADAKAGDKVSQATLVSGVVRASGKLDMYMEGVPYTPQLPWGCNADPDVPAARGFANKATYEVERVAPYLGWSGTKNEGVEGIYIDSMEGWGELHNYNKDHWRTTQFPLTFDPVNRNKVSLLNFWGTYNFVLAMSDRLHKDGMLLMGNDAFYRKWQLARWVDIPGREYTWTDDKGKFVPVEEEHMLFLRSMAYRKPYVMLMNNAFEDGSIMEPYFQRALFYGVFPSMFQANQAENEVMYFSNPAWYDRDRHLFKKYIPLIRQLDEAGWEPVPFATVSPQSARIERWGSFPAGTLTYTVQNASDREEAIELDVDVKALGIFGNVAADEMIASQPIQSTPASQSISLRLRLPAKGYGMIRLGRAK